VCSRALREFKLRFGQISALMSLLIDEGELHEGLRAGLSWLVLHEGLRAGLSWLVLWVRTLPSCLSSALEFARSTKHEGCICYYFFDSVFVNFGNIACEKCA
jgi:hypothetical protein